jgi:hypothetical protein
MKKMRFLLQRGRHADAILQATSDLSKAVRRGPKSLFWRAIEWVQSYGLFVALATYYMGSFISRIAKQRKVQRERAKREAAFLVHLRRLQVRGRQTPTPAVSVAPRSL